MTPSDIAHQRLHSQQIAESSFETPGEVVQWMGAVQAQDYPAAKWALGLRCRGLTAARIDQAFAEGSILRTHVMRPTWHFVTPADIRWMLALTAPRVSGSYRKLELDNDFFKRSNAVLAQALQGGNQLTRAELVAILRQAGVGTDVQLQSGAHYIIGQAELDGIVCSGGIRDKQFTYALLDERVPQAPAMERDQALAELASRYFTSHGPATLRDYIWWSGLAVADAKAGLAMIKSRLSHEVVDDQTYWFAPSSATKNTAPTAHLLPNFDEYLVGYTDRSAAFDDQRIHQLNARGNLLFSHIIVVNGKVVGTWKRTLKQNAVALELNQSAPLTSAEQAAVAVAIERYGSFLEKSTMIV